MVRQAFKMIIYLLVGACASQTEREHHFERLSKKETNESYKIDEFCKRFIFYQMLSETEHERLQKQMKGYINHAFNQSPLDRIPNEDMIGFFSGIEGYRDERTRYESNLLTMPTSEPSLISGNTIMFAKCLGTRFTITSFAKSVNTKQDGSQKPTNRRRSKKSAKTRRK